MKILYLEFHRHYKLLALHEEILNYLEQVKQKVQKLVVYGYAEAVDIDVISYELAKQEQECLALKNNMELLKKQFENLVGVSNYFPEPVKTPFLLEEFKAPNTYSEIDSIGREKKELRLFAEKAKILDEEMKGIALWKPNIGINLRSGFEGFTDNINAKDQFFYLGVVSVNWTLFEGGRNKSKKHQLKLQQELIASEKKLYEEDLSVMLHKAITKLKVQEEELKVLERKKLLSKRLMNHEKKRYLQGDVDVVSLLNYKTKYKEDVTKYYSTKISYLQSLIHYNWLISD